MITAKSYKRLNNFSTAEGPVAGAPFFIQMIIAQSSISSTTKNQAVRETPPLVRLQQSRHRRRTGQNRRNITALSIRIGRSFMSSTKTEERQQVSRGNCREPAWSIHPERLWSRRMPSVRIEFDDKLKRSYMQTEPYFKVPCIRSTRVYAWYSIPVINIFQKSSRFFLNFTPYIMQTNFSLY